MAGPIDLKPGDVFTGDYRVVRLLGEGGMGAVYEVDQISTGRRRALKLMLPELVQRPDVRKRFETEARVGAQIASDHVVEVIASGVEARTGTPWLVMELLDGEDLDKYLTRKDALSPAEVREVLDQLCHALGEAHKQGIVHRDLKPENIFLAKARRKGVPFVVKILDFGIAKIVAEVKTTSSKTRGVVGSPLWMAPEQANPEMAVGPAADVWSLGLIAFRLLTGRCFWKTAYVEGASFVMLINEAFVMPTPAASARAGEYGRANRLPPGFDGWFARCVARAAGTRYPDATQAYEGLEPVLGGPAGVTPMPPTPTPMPIPTPGPPRPGLDPTQGSGTVPGGPPDVKQESRPRISMLPASPRPASRPSRLWVGVGGLVVLGGLGAILWPKNTGSEGAPDASATATVMAVNPPPPPTTPPKDGPCPEGMVPIPEGTFAMGSPKGEGVTDEQPPHKVKLSAFCMDKTEVTVAAYRRCVSAAKCAPAPTTVNYAGYSADTAKVWSQFCNGDRSDRDAYPINCVDWSQADAYCKWTGGRLPTEAQWEYAARGTEGRKYPWGNDKPGPKLLNACGTECRALGERLGTEGGKVLYEEDDGAEATAPVGKYALGDSSFGVSDMVGNVWEWVDDWYALYKDSPTPPLDPAVAVKSPGGEGRRVLRGAGWLANDASQVRAAYRGSDRVSFRDSNVGFRCARGQK